MFQKLIVGGCASCMLGSERQRSVGRQGHADL